MPSKSEVLKKHAELRKKIIEENKKDMIKYQEAYDKIKDDPTIPDENK